MPPKKTQQKKYSLEAIHQAYLAVTSDGLSVRGAAKEYGIPTTTLYDRVRGKTNPVADYMGRQQLFTWVEERRICRHLNQMSDWGYGLTKAEVIDLATDYAEELGKERDHTKRLSKKWHRLFVLRNKDILKVLFLLNTYTHSFVTS